MSLRKHLSTKEKDFIISFGVEVIPKDVETFVSQWKSSTGLVATSTVIVEIATVYILCKHLKKDYNPVKVKMVNVLDSSFRPHERDCFFNVICRLALVQTQGHILNRLELSNQLLQKGYGCLGDVNLYGMIDDRTKHQELEYTDPNSNCFSFVHIHIQHFLAAINLLKLPLMEIFQFIRKYVLLGPESQVGKNSAMVLQFFFGLAKSIFGEGAQALLQNVLKFLTQHINRDSPIIDSKVSLLILTCLYEAQDVNLYRQVLNETFVRHIFAYEVATVDEYAEVFAHYLTHTSDQTKHAIPWTVYCSNKHKSLGKRLTDLKGCLATIKHNSRLTLADPKRIVISNKNFDYLLSVLTDLTGGSNADSISVTSSSSLLTATDSVSVAMVSDSSYHSQDSLLSTTDCVSGPYGYLTREQYESSRQAQTTFYYNMMKDFVAPNLQMHCTTLVHTQYRKNDHVWFSFSPSMRYSFYECVEITPVIPMHWVKVPQPDGSQELEDKYKIKAHQSHIPESTEHEVAELVVLNSHRPERISITGPSGTQPVVISLYPNSDQSDDNGEIGCDYLMQCHEVMQEVKWRKDSGFDISRDEQIGRELPLPSKKGTESAEITTSTAMANLKEVTQSPSAVKIPPVKLASTKLFARPLGEGPDVNVSEQQLKRWAMEGFDRPGFCFYGDGELFQMGYEYTLPDQLPNTRTIREGGNGTVLEVYYEGTFYAVKKTAFRWREVLIMPKLKHPNILRLATMLMGTPLLEYPRRRYVYQYFPRLTNDLGRSIGSYERYCLKTLKERYRTEDLLLSRIIENFKYVAREVLEALNYLHSLSAPIVHRDVKPSNLLVKSECGCANPLVCVCRLRPLIILSDFDASLELSPEGDLIPDSTHSHAHSYYTTHDRLYHISPVGTVGFKSPEGFMHVVSNSLEILPQLCTKADVFSFGLLMILLFMNEDGPRHLNQIGTLLLSMNQTPADRSGQLPAKKVDILKKNKVIPRKLHLNVTERDITRILPLRRLRQDFADMPELIDFVERSLTVNPRDRPSARELLRHPYLTE